VKTERQTWDIVDDSICYERESCSCCQAARTLPCHWQSLLRLQCDWHCTAARRCCVVPGSEIWPPPEEAHLGNDLLALQVTQQLLMSCLCAFCSSTRLHTGSADNNGPLTAVGLLERRVCIYAHAPELLSLWRRQTDDSIMAVIMPSHMLAYLMIKVQWGKLDDTLPMPYCAHAV